MTGQEPAWIRRVVSPHITSIPPYVPGKPIEEVERELGITGACKMASNENPLGPSPRVVEAIREAMASVHVYPEDGAPVLRAALAQRFGVSEASILLGNGSDEILSLCSHLFVTAGTETIVGASTFSMYRIFTEGHGGRVVRVPMVEHRFDLSAMARAVTENTRLVFLANPNNPTGTIVRRDEWEAFLKDLPAEGLVIVLDEAYREFVQDGECLSGLDYLGARPPILVLRTFSKFYSLAGLRIGYGLAEPWLIDLLNRIRAPFTVNLLAQKAALAALEDKDHQERSLRNNYEGRDFFRKELTALGLNVIESHANFITFCLRKDAEPVYSGLLHGGIIVRHLASFGMKNCIRVTVGLPDENRRFIEKLKHVLAQH